MTSAVLAPPEPQRGCQPPRIAVLPPDVALSLGAEAVDLARSAGLVLDPWQGYSLDVDMSRRSDGMWAAFEFGQVVSRQNGKGGWLEARELHALYLGEEELIIHTAHKFDTSAEAFRRIHALVDNTDDLRREVKRVSNTHGSEGIELVDGTRLLFKARSTGATRGFSSDLLIWDEAMILAGDPVQAMLPTLSARRNPHVIYTGSAGNQASVAFGRLRRRCLAMAGDGRRERIAWLEWSVDEDAYRSGEIDPADPRQWAIANPALGIRLSEEFTRGEMGAFGGPWSTGFAQERLGIGDWPPADEEDRWAVIGREDWFALADPESRPKPRPVAFAVEMSWDRTATCIAVAGRRSDGRLHGEISADGRELDYRTGPADWVPDRLAGMRDRWAPVAVVVNSKGPAGSLIPAIEARGVQVLQPTATDLGQGFGILMDACDPKASMFRHPGQEPLNLAVAGAAKRKVGDAWMWDLRESVGDAAPIVAVTNAVLGLAKMPEAPFFAARR